MFKKKPTWKKRAKLFEEALAKEELVMARMKGLFHTMVYVFGTEVMTSVREWSVNPTEENMEVLEKVIADWIKEKKETTE